jgi:hypothetical protein
MRKEQFRRPMTHLEVWLYMTLVSRAIRLNKKDKKALKSVLRCYASTVKAKRVI